MRSASVFVVFLAVGLACGGVASTETTPSAEVAPSVASKPSGRRVSTASFDSCRAYVEHVNALACVTRKEDVDEKCGPFKLLPSDLKPYWACMTEASRCEGDTYVADVAPCQPLAVP